MHIDERGRGRKKIAVNGAEILGRDIETSLLAYLVEKIPRVAGA
ncbi:MAG: hypothetical protein ACXWUK_13870 [Burkholderiales bacterium]